MVVRMASQAAVLLWVTAFVQHAYAEVLYVDGRMGNDAYSGTLDKPLQSLLRAAERVNANSAPGPATIKMAPGLYSLDQTVVFDNRRACTQENRLTIEATVLPDDPNWLPHLMPIIASKQIPRVANGSASITETYSLKIKVSHVTIRGLKFLGNAASNNWHNCIERVGKDLDDLVITQCVFEGDRKGADIYCAALATGNRFMVDHCLFKDCGACVVFWDGTDGVPGHGCAMHHCIVNKAYLSGVWTCQTAEDFEFHHNVVVASEYLWLRKPGDTQTYRVRRCVATGNKHESGYGVASGPTGPTGPTVHFEKEQVIGEGTVVFDTDKSSRRHGHVAKRSAGDDLGAGLFTRQSP